MLPGGGCGAFRPGVSQPRDHMFILWALIEEQQRLIFMEKKIIKAGKGRVGGGGGGDREGFGSCQTPRGCGRLGRGSAHPSAVGVGTVPGWVGPPWTLYRKQVSLLLAFHPLPRQSGPLPGALRRSRGGGGA